MCGASVPVHGGVVLDLCALSGIRGVDRPSMLVDVLAGTFGDAFEDELQASHGLTVGHWPQSMSLSTVGGWLACRGAGQYSTRYGKIEDIVVGLDVVLADGRQITTGGHPRQAAGPDLTQLFVGSEGTLGVITGARLRAHPVPPHEGRAAYGFGSFAAGLDAMRRILRRGATPAVLRLYDDVETQRNFDVEGTHALLVLDEGDRTMVDATLEVVAEECRLEAERELDVALVERWMGHRNDVAALEALIGKGFVVDTMEVSASWAQMPKIYEAATRAIAAVPGAMAASAHQSHTYTDGGCLYFTFAGGVEPDDRDRFYRAAWDAGTRAVLEGGGALSHHHGVGLNRSRFMREALGPAFDSLVAVKRALDPNGILNPGKLGLPSPWGEVSWSSTSLRSWWSMSAPAGCGPRSSAPTRRSPPSTTGRCCPAPPHPASSTSTPPRWPTAALDVAHAALAEAGPVGGGRHRQPAGIDHRLGPQATGEPVGPGIGWQDLRTVVDCLVLQEQDIRLAPNLSATKLKFLLDRRPGGTGTSASAPSTRGSPGPCPAAPPTSPTGPT